MRADRYEDLRKAIDEAVFVRRSSRERLINGDERTPMDWVFDFRALILQPRWLERYAEIFWERYAPEYPFQICGMETAAIALVAAIVMKGVQRGTPVNGFYIRKSRKRVGRLRQIEGTPNKEKVILVDDLINSGTTFKRQILVLEDAGLAVSDIFAFVAFKAAGAYRPLGPRVQTLFTLEDFGVPLKSDRDDAPPSPKILWRFRAPGAVLHNYVHQKSTPALDENGSIYFGTDAGSMFAIDARNGNPIWEFRIPSMNEPAIFSSPALHRAKVYFGSNDGSIYALDKSTGELTWRYDDADWVGSSSAVAHEHDTVFIGLQYGLLNKYGALVALNTETGGVLWKADLPGSGRASPLYISSQRMVIMGDSFGNVCGYDALTGAIRFRSFIKGEIFGGFAYQEEKKTVFFASGNGACYGIFVPTGDITFAKDLGLPIYSTPAVRDDTIYVSSLDKKIYALDIESGQEKWSFATNGRIFASPRLIADSLWCGSNDGKLYELNIRSGVLFSTLQMSERIGNPIILDHLQQRIFVTTHGNSLYCIDPQHIK